MSGTRMTALPAKHFAVGPYRAEHIHGQAWGVFNKTGVNVLTFAEKPGAVFTDETHAKAIADEWNSRTEPFVYPADPYVPPVTTRMTDEEMTAYTRSRKSNIKTMDPEKSKLSSAVLEAGGHIEDRAGYPDFHKFVKHYVFTKEALLKFIELVKEQPDESI